MKIKKCMWFQPCTKKQKARFFILAEAICNACGYEEKVRIGYDKLFYHECDEGNVVTYVPRNIK